MTNARSLHICDYMLGNLVTSTHPEDDDFDASLTEELETPDSKNCSDVTTEDGNITLRIANNLVYITPTPDHHILAHGDTGPICL